jgi:hypothetical protein
VEGDWLWVALRADRDARRSDVEDRTDPIDDVQETPPQAFLPLTESYEEFMFLL